MTQAPETSTAIGPTIENAEKLRALNLQLQIARSEEEKAKLDTANSLLQLGVKTTNTLPVNSPSAPSSNASSAPETTAKPAEVKPLEAPAAAVAQAPPSPTDTTGNVLQAAANAVPGVNVVGTVASAAATTYEGIQNANNPSSAQFDMWAMTKAVTLEQQQKLKPEWEKAYNMAIKANNTPDAAKQFAIQYVEKKMAETPVSESSGKLAPIEKFFGLEPGFFSGILDMVKNFFPDILPMLSKIPFIGGLFGDNPEEKKEEEENQPQESPMPAPPPGPFDANEVRGNIMNEEELKNINIGEIKDQKELVNALYPFAQHIQSKYKIPWKVVMAQAILESGWNTNLYSERGYGIFNIVAHKNYEGESQERGDHNATGEKITQKFRTYNTLYEAFEDFGKKLSTEERYKACARDGITPEESIDAILKGGYAEDPEYKKKIMNIIEDIDKFTYQEGGTYTHIGLENNVMLPLEKKIRTSILETAREMVDNKDSTNQAEDKNASRDVLDGKIKISCWDWANEVYERRGIKLDFIYESYGEKKAPPKAMVDDIKPGDRLVVYNENKIDKNGEHSVIFAGWVGEGQNRKMQTYMFPGSGDPKTRDYPVPDDTYIRGIAKPVAA